MACHVNLDQSHGKREEMGKAASRARQSLLVFLLFCWGRKSSVLCLTLHVKLGVILRSVCFGYSSSTILYNHLCNTASAYFYLPIDDEPHQDDASTRSSYTRSLSWDGSEESSTDHSDDSFTRPASPVTAGSRHRRRQEIADILEQKDLYNILGLSRTPAPDKMELRRAYLSRSRACHPECVFDSFIPLSIRVDVFTFILPDSKFPNNPEATYAFQKVSVAYNVLSDPASKRVYDSHPASHEFSSNMPGATMRAEETLRTVIVGILNDFLDGDLEMVRTLLRRSLSITMVGMQNL
jgi:hypothetical protein